MKPRLQRPAAMYRPSLPAFDFPPWRLSGVVVGALRNEPAQLDARSALARARCSLQAASPMPGFAPGHDLAGAEASIFDVLRADHGPRGSISPRFA